MRGGTRHRIQLAVFAVVLLMAATVSLAGPEPAGAAVTTGHLRDSAGHPYAGWQVDVYGLGNPFPNLIATTTTDSAGAFSFNGTGSVSGFGFTGPPTPAGWRPMIATGHIFGTVSPPYDVTVPVVAASVTVTDQHGAPVVGATVASTGVTPTGGTISLPALLPGADSNSGSQAPVSVTTDATGKATLHLLQSASVKAELVVTPPSGSGLTPSTTLPNITLASASSRTVVLAPTTTAAVSGVARDASGALLSGWGVTFQTGADTSHAVSTTTAADGSYSMQVPLTADRVTLVEPAPFVTIRPSITSTGLSLTGDRRLDLTRPTVAVDVLVLSPTGTPVRFAFVSADAVGSSSAPVATGPLFAGATSSVGWQSYANGQAGPDGHLVLRRLKTAAASPLVSAGPGTGPGQDWQTISAPVALAADIATTITLVPLPVITIGAATATAPFAGTKTVQVPVTISPASVQVNANVRWRTIEVDGAPGNQAPISDYVPSAGFLSIVPGQTTASVPVTIKANSTDEPEYIVISLDSPSNAKIGGYWGLGFVTIDPVPRVLPGTGSILAPRSGTSVLEVPVSLTMASAVPVTVQWTTLRVDGAPGNQAPTSDYVAASGVVTFAPGQTTASVPITVTGNTSGADEYLVVSFTGPTNAVMGGFWGLGFGTIRSP